MNFKTRQILRGSLKDGYLRVSFGGRKDRVQFKIHQLVALVFLGPCPEGKEPDHINGIKTDNKASNLEYVTHLENQRRAAALGLYKGSLGEQHGMVKLTGNQVQEIRQRYAAGGITQYQLAEEYRIQQPAISSILRRKTWKHI